MLCSLERGQSFRQLGPQFRIGVLPGWKSDVFYFHGILMVRLRDHVYNFVLPLLMPTKENCALARANHKAGRSAQNIISRRTTLEITSGELPAFSIIGRILIMLELTICGCRCLYTRGHPRKHCQVLKGSVFYIKCRRSYCRTAWLVSALGVGRLGCCQEDCWDYFLLFCNLHV
jgi:hypothetical protein